MTEARYFDEDAFDAGLADDAVQAMARRQFSISLVVALALLATAGLTIVRAPHEAPVEMAAPHKIMRAEALRMEVAQPALTAATRG